MELLKSHNTPEHIMCMEVPLGNMAAEETDLAVGIMTSVHEVAKEASIGTHKATKESESRHVYLVTREMGLAQLKGMRSTLHISATFQYNSR